MGTDITVFVERLVEGKWLTVNTLTSFSVNGPDEFSNPPACRRNYVRFHKLRSDEILERGLPADLSDYGKWAFQYEGAASHLAAWLPILEAADIWLRTEAGGMPEWVTGAESAALFFFDVDEVEVPHRIVFWFDQ